RFTSAMIATRSPRSAAVNEGGREVPAASRSTEVRRARKAGNWSRVELRIWSSETGILSFGRSSGIVVRALFGRTADEENADAPGDHRGARPDAASAGSQLRPPGAGHLHDR